MYCTICAAAAGCPSWDHNCSAAELSDFAMASTANSYARCGLLRNAAIARGTLMVDHATPVVHWPSDSTSVGVATATPMVGEIVAESRSKLASSAWCRI